MDKLRFINGDGAVFAHFHTGLTAKTFFAVDRIGLAVLQFVHFHGTDVDAFAAADTLVGINNRIVSHDFLQAVCPGRTSPKRGVLAVAVSAGLCRPTCSWG